MKRGVNRVLPIVRIPWIQCYRSSWMQHWMKSFSGGNDSEPGDAMCYSAQVRADFRKLEREFGTVLTKTWQRLP